MDEIEINRVKSPKVDTQLIFILLLYHLFNLVPWQEFYCVRLKWRQKFREDFQLMQSYFQSHPPVECNPAVMRPKMRVLIQSLTKHKTWERAEICKVNARSCKILFLDSGEVEEDVDFSSIFNLPSPWTQKPPYGVFKLIVSGTVSLNFLIMANRGYQPNLRKALNEDTRKVFNRGG